MKGNEKQNIKNQKTTEKLRITALLAVFLAEGCFNKVTFLQVGSVQEKVGLCGVTGKYIVTGYLPKNLEMYQLPSSVFLT